MVAKGMSYKQIAERLVLSHRTVQNHVQNTLRKLQMHNRVELTRYAIERGLDDDDDERARCRRVTADGRRTCARLGYADRPAPTYDTAGRRCTGAHLDAVPYENLGIMLGRPPSVDPVDVAWRGSGEVGRAGYCFHQNGALETVLTELGFEVSRRHGHVWTSEDDRHDRRRSTTWCWSSTGLPTDDNPGGEWWPDVGLGDAFGDPLPLVVGRVRAGRLRLRDHRGTRRRLVVPRRPARARSPASRSRRVADRSAEVDGRARVALHAARRSLRHACWSCSAGCPSTSTWCAAASSTGSPPDGQTETELTSYDAWRERHRRRLRAVAGRGRRRRAAGALRRQLAACTAPGSRRDRG